MKSFLFMFACMEGLIFYDQCVGLNVILGDFATRLGVAMIKVVNPQEVRMENITSYRRLLH